jgi:pimeloyl-ACP methyl ester carboxylesterase
VGAVPYKNRSDVYAAAMSWQLRRRAQTRRGEIAWDVHGEGLPVVLAHGTPSRSLVWREVVLALAERHEVYVWDLLGFGDSERYVDQDVSLVAHSEVLAELVEQWGLDRPALVGHDIGAAVILRAHLLESVAASHLGLIDGVVLAPWITPRTREMQQSQERWSSLPDPELGKLIAEHLRTATVGRLSDEVWHGLFGQWEGARGQALYLRNLAQLDEEHTRAFEALLPTITAPTAIVWGQQDAWLPVETAQRIADRIPGATSTKLPQAGHFSMEDDPAGVSHALAGLLGRR